MRMIFILPVLMRVIFTNGDLHPTVLSRPDRPAGCFSLAYGGETLCGTSLFYCRLVMCNRCLTSDRLASGGLVHLALSLVSSWNPMIASSSDVFCLQNVVYSAAIHRDCLHGSHTYEHSERCCFMVRVPPRKKQELLLVVIPG